jgi:ADP-ribosyl-[dinitrogen reductase] hydrolase
MKAQKNTMIKTPDRRSRILGCMLGGAIGDAMGAPVKFLGLAEIYRRFGKKGITLYEAVFGRYGAITADTQMALFTAEGLILSTVRKEYSQENQLIPALYHAYLRWLYTQEVQLQQQLIGSHGTCSVVDGILTGYKNLFARRAPENTCLLALRSGQMGTMDLPLNDSNRCGGIMRVAPIGLAFRDPDIAFLRGCEAAVITHGHPSGYLAAGFFSAFISLLVSGNTLEKAVTESTLLLQSKEKSNDCVWAVEKAVALADKGNLSPEKIESLGSGWSAEEALSIGLCCALSAESNFSKGVLLSVNHSGNSDATGSITGNILGALSGRDSIPEKWLSGLEMREVIEEVAVDVMERFSSRS